METSLLRTLARKHDSSVNAMAARHKAKIDTLAGLRTCFEAGIQRDGRNPLVARFGGIPLRRQKTAVLTDRQPTRAPHPHKELISRLLHSRCELCGHTDGIQVHQVRRLADLGKPGQPKPAWAVLMAKRRRKTLAVCRRCHDQTHNGQPTATPTE